MMSRITTTFPPGISSPVHPGEIIREQYLPDIEMTGAQLAKAAGIPVARFNRVLAEKEPLTAEVAIKLGDYFGQAPQYWMNLQSQYELALAHQRMIRRAQRSGATPKRRKSA